jgi:multimeric flavodoxin WrbA
MKILAIIGSPRKENTFSLVKRFEKRLIQTNDVDFEYLFLKDYNIGICKGCLNCVRLGEDSCPKSETISKIVSKMNKCDGIIFASPVYIDNVTGLMKNFIDHLVYIVHRPQFLDKYALILATTKGSGLNEVLEYLKKTALKLGFSVVGKFGIRTPTFDSEEKEQEIKELCKDFFHSIKTKRWIKPSFWLLLYFKTMRFLVGDLLRDDFKLDYKYWQNKGWLESTYFKDGKVGWFKNIVSKIILFFVKRNIKRNKRK